MIWWFNFPKRNVISLTVMESGLWGEKGLLTTTMAFLVSPHILKLSAIRQPTMNCGIKGWGICISQIC